MIDMTRPVPIPKPQNMEFWNGLAEGHVLIHQCQHCGQNWIPARARCSNCGGTDLRWTRSKGIGRIVAFTTVYRGASPFFKGVVPYTVAIIELQEGPRLLTNLCFDASYPPEKGQSVVCRIDEAQPGGRVLLFDAIYE